VTGQPVEIRLDRILLPRCVPAGLDLAVLGLWVCRQRKTADPVDPPILVRREGDYFRITDGRHRFTAAVASGRDAIAAVIEND
jgi:hypothetical protein